MQSHPFTKYHFPSVPSKHLTPGQMWGNQRICCRNLSKEARLVFTKSYKRHCLPSVTLPQDIQMTILTYISQLIKNQSSFLKIFSFPAVSYFLSTCFFSYLINLCLCPSFSTHIGFLSLYSIGQFFLIPSSQCLLFSKGKYQNWQIPVV